MGSPLPRGRSCCSRLPKASSPPPAPQPLANVPHGRANATGNRPRRAVVNAFLFNTSSNGSTSSASAINRTRESIANRLSELRNPHEDDDYGPHDNLSSHGSDDDSGAGESLCIREHVEAGTRVRIQMGPWPADSLDNEDGDNSEQGGALTTRAMGFMITDPRPEIKLLHRFKPGQGPHDSPDFWRSFMHKCRLAWGVFFPPEHHLARRPSPAMPSSPLAHLPAGLGRMLMPWLGGPGGRMVGGDGEGTAVNGMTAKEVVLSRLQMVLIADRCGVPPEHLLEMKAQTLTALAEYLGKDLEEDLAQLEVQVSALKPSGERITMTIGFADMLADEQLRDPLGCHYEFEDDDDYFFPEEDDGRVADIAEAPPPPTSFKVIHMVTQQVLAESSEGAVAAGGVRGRDEAL